MVRDTSLKGWKSMLVDEFLAFSSSHFRVKLSYATIDLSKKKSKKPPMFWKFVKAGSTAIGCTARVWQKKRCNWRAPFGRCHQPGPSWARWQQAAFAKASPKPGKAGCWVWRQLRLPWRCGKPRSSGHLLQDLKVSAPRTRKRPEKPVSVEAIGNASCCTTVSHKNTCLVMGKLTSPWRRPGVSKGTPGFVRSGKTERRGGTKNKV